MAYRVTALKYRPQVFAELVGQEAIVRTLQNANRAARLSHAYIFAGPRGVGKTTTARILAKTINCENLPPGDLAARPAPEPCNRCRSCIEITEGRSLDVVEIDGASNRRIEEVRDLRENVKFPPVRSRYKVYIIDEFHMLTNEAFNALLKTLEEPPAYVKFFMATTAPEKVPLTIQSRCQRFDFRLLGREEIADNLQKIADSEGLRLERASLLAVARAAEGSLRDAQSLLDQVVAFAGDAPEQAAVEDILHLVRGEVLDRFLRAVAGRDAAALMRIIDELAARGYEMRRFLQELLEWLRGMVLVSVSPELVDLIPLVAEDRKMMLERASAFSRGRLTALLQTAMEAERELKNSASPRYTMELAALKMTETADFDTLKSLLERLEEAARIPGSEENSSGAPPRGGEDPGRGEERETRDGETVLEEFTTGQDGEEEDLEGEGEDPGGEEPLELAPDGEEAATPAPTDDWRGFIEEVNKRSVSLGAILEHGRIVSKEAQGMVIAFPRAGKFFLERATETENQAIIQEAAQRYFGGKVRVRLQLLEQEGAAPESERPTDLMKKKRREALKNPLVQDILDRFGGKVLDVKIL